MRAINEFQAVGQWQSRSVIGDFRVWRVHATVEALQLVASDAAALRDFSDRLLHDLSANRPGTLGGVWGIQLWQKVAPTEESLRDTAGIIATVISVQPVEHGYAVGCRIENKR
ncbi:MAG TPA: hypothetical protein VFW05_15810 [Verrucomicrobiae bacterium]|nr:hypothetical protein [Verrucomicrobiae bacterium]